MDGTRYRRPFALALMFADPTIGRTRNETWTSSSESKSMVKSKSTEVGSSGERLAEVDWSTLLWTGQGDLVLCPGWRGGGSVSRSQTTAL